MRVVLLISLLLAAPVCLAADDGPWPFPELGHRRHFVVEPHKGGAGRTAVVSFGTGGVMAPEGRDVRVVTAAGQGVPFRVLHIGPGSVCRLAFNVMPQVRDYYVFYGSKAAKPDAPAWAPDAGLLLETRRFNGGSFRNFNELRKVIGQSRPRLGADIVEQVFHGHNPFGPSDNYVSIYRGAIRIDKGGEYTFATTSDDASAMLVDGKVVAGKYGRGGAPRNARFMGKPLRLTPGRHDFVYYHVEVDGAQAAVAAWKPPGGKWAVIPSRAFGPVLQAKSAGYAVRGRAVAPDIRATNSGEVIFRGKRMTRFSFRNATLHPDVFQFKPHWDFGDGASSETVNPEHIYFEFGEYDVALTLSRAGKSYEVRYRVVVDEGWERQTVRNSDNLRQYHGIIKRYQFGKMKIPHIDRAMDVFEELGAHEEILEAGGVMAARKEEASDPIYLRHCLLYAEHLCREKELRDKRPKQKTDDGSRDEYAGLDFFSTAVGALTDAENRLQKPEHKVKTALKRGDVFFYYVRDLEKARAEYERILKIYRSAEVAEVRTAQIRLGDYFRKKGQTADARKAYEKANEAPAYDRDYKKDAARQGALHESAENYLRRGELDAARRQLNTWEWEHPEVKLEGRSSLLRAELAAKEENYNEALAQLQELVTGNKGGALAPEALLRIAKLHIKLGNYRRAIAACERLAADYADSSLKEDAGRLSAECEEKSKE